VYVVKKQNEENGTLLYFEKDGSVENLIKESIHTKGLKEFTNDETKIGDTF